MHTHPFHLVSTSPWPLLASISSLMFTSGLVIWFTYSSLFYLFLGLFCLLLVLFFWFRDIISEATYFGSHTIRVQSGLRLGMCLFIVSEVFFFFGFFWAYLHSASSPAVEIGSLWPPKGLTSLSALGLPLLNTFLLLTSGATVTFSHTSLVRSKFLHAVTGLLFTLGLGFAFLIFQLQEFKLCSFCISDSVYGSCFFLLTGFHGFHVLLGTLFLLESYFRLILRHFNSSRHLNFTVAIWYWHFVDVVWLLLYVLCYFWGS